MESHQTPDHIKKRLVTVLKHGVKKRKRRVLVNNWQSMKDKKLNIGTWITLTTVHKKSSS